MSRITSEHSRNFSEKQGWSIEQKTEDTEILYMTVSKDEKKIGVALGVNVIKDIYKVTQIAVYRADSRGHFTLEKQLDFEFEDEACITFFFNNNDTEELLFFTMDEVFKFNYMGEDTTAK